MYKVRMIELARERGEPMDLLRQQLRLWLERRLTGAGRFDYINLKQDIRHSMNQNHRDLKRRGLSNREGAKNRRWRKYEQNAPRILFSTPCFEITA